jgi:L-asparagine transporter-like permease
MHKPSDATERHFGEITLREKGLKHALTSGQMGMIALGGAIGTGLFLGSGFAIGFAGPSVMISYAIGALIALLLIGCLAEMTVAQPTSGSFGTYADFYISPLAGFLVRYGYWTSYVLAIGMEVTAVAIYMKYWFPTSQSWVWITVFSVALIGINSISVKIFGFIEYWFSMIKVVAIVVFILLGSYMVYGAPNDASSSIGFKNYVDYGGFFPKGIWGTWIAVIVAIFSYLGIEMIAIAAGEAEKPEVAVVSAFRTSIVRLVVFYILTLGLMLAIMPWTEAGNGKSPFVQAMEAIHIPGAASVINFVVLVAALSAMNGQLYATSRMMFSLSRANQAPRIFGQLNRHQTPLNALILSCSGVAVAAVLSVQFGESSFTLMMSIAMFGTMFAWGMIFITHLFFRRRLSREGRALSFRMWGFPYLTILGAVLIFSVLISTLFTNEFYYTVIFGIPFFLLITAMYFAFYRDKKVVVLKSD